MTISGINLRIISLSRLVFAFDSQVTVMIVKTVVLTRNVIYSNGDAYLDFSRHDFNPQLFHAIRTESDQQPTHSVKHGLLLTGTISCFNQIEMFNTRSDISIQFRRRKLPDSILLIWLDMEWLGAALNWMFTRSITVVIVSKSWFSFFKSEY